MNVDGSGLLQLTDNPGSDTWPDWLLDGLKIVFESERSHGSNPGHLLNRRHESRLSAVVATCYTHSIFKTKMCVLDLKS